MNILHLSDIHYGKNHVANERKQRSTYKGDSYDKELEEIKEGLEYLEKKFNVRPNFIVVTGDIAETSTPDEYILAERFLGGIADYLKIDRRYVVMVPGNHDVNWEICKKERRKIFRQRLNLFLFKLLKYAFLGRIFHDAKRDVGATFFSKFDNYKRFFNCFYKQADFPENICLYEFSEKLFVNFPFYDEKIVFCGLNSCVDESDQRPHHGRITEYQLIKAIEDINNIDPKRNFLRVALMHHNYLRESTNDEANLVDAHNLKQIFLDADFQFLLHGHGHKDDVDRKGDQKKFFYIFVTGSIGLDKQAIPEIGRRFQVIAINNYSAQIFRWRFDTESIGKTGKGKWILQSTEDPFILENFNRHKAYQALQKEVKRFELNSSFSLFVFNGKPIGQYEIRDNLVNNLIELTPKIDSGYNISLRINCEIINGNISHYCKTQREFEDISLQNICLQILDQLNSMPENNKPDNLAENTLKYWHKNVPCVEKPMDNFYRFFEGIILSRYIPSNAKTNIFLILDYYEKLFLNDTLSDNQIDVSQLTYILEKTFSNQKIEGNINNIKIIIISASEEFPQAFRKAKDVLRFPIEY